MNFTVRIESRHWPCPPGTRGVAQEKGSSPLEAAASAAASEERLPNACRPVTVRFKGRLEVDQKFISIHNTRFQIPVTPLLPSLAPAEMEVLCSASGWELCLRSCPSFPCASLTRIRPHDALGSLRFLVNP